MWQLALSTSGPETPKWVNSISPSSEKTSLPLWVSTTRRVTFFKESPIMSRQYFSLQTSGISEGRSGVTRCPAWRASW